MKRVRALFAYAAVAALGEVGIDGDTHSTAATKQHLAGVALRRAFNEVMA